jgi:hypothetical protein
MPRLRWCQERIAQSLTKDIELQPFSLINKKVIPSDLVP